MKTDNQIASEDELYPREGIDLPTKIVVSASRRTDLVAHFPAWLARVLAEEKARVLLPSRRAKDIDLHPARVHTLVLWSKDFTHLLRNQYGLQDLCRKYAQVYFHFTITGLGGTPVERHVLRPDQALAQIKPLLNLAGSPERISLRFDPIVFWWEGKDRQSNLSFFLELARAAATHGVKQIRFSFAQWYRKAQLRAGRAGFPYFDPPEEEKLRAAESLSRIGQDFGLELFACAQPFLTRVAGIKPSACIDGRWLQKTHPQAAPASWQRDRTQRADCGCTESVDIGSYTQSCPHSCLYCYANTRL